MPEPRIASEIDLISDYLDQHLTALRYAVHGLSDDQARATPCASALSLGGLMKHAIWVMNQLQVRRSDPAGQRSVEDLQAHAGEFFGSFALTEDEQFDDVVAAFDRAHETFIASVRASDPSAEVMAPPEPWEGRNEPTPTVERFHLMHLIGEFAQHAGHADIIREQVDGATSMPLKFAVEGRPGNDFITPWQPRAERS